MPASCFLSFFAADAGRFSQQRASLPLPIFADTPAITPLAAIDAAITPSPGIRRVPLH